MFNLEGENKKSILDSGDDGSNLMLSQINNHEEAYRGRR